MMSKYVTWNIVNIILALGTSVWATPICRSRFRTEVVCIAGKNDYILQRGLVSDNNKTVAITLKDCRITDINQDAFKNLYFLEEIDLSGNKISNLKKGILDGITKLKNLRLAKNLLTSIPSGFFDTMPSLQRLDLSDNKIDRLDQGIFNHLPKLVRLELNGMSFLGKDLDPALFSQNPKIQYLRMSNNDMSGTPDSLLSPIRGFIVLGLNNCSLTEVPKFATGINVRTLEQLYLQYNKIRRLDDPTIFSNFENLVFLDLTLNPIENLNENVFKSMPKINSIDLSFNKLVEVPENLFQSMISLESVDLSNNLIRKVSVNAFRGTRLKKLNLNANRLTYLDNNFLLELRNSKTRLTAFYFADNLLQCACLLEILREVKKFSVEYNSDKYNGEEPVCYTTKQFTCMRHDHFEYDYPIDIRQMKKEISVK